MRTDTKKMLAGMFASVVLVAGLSLLAVTAHADGPSPQNYADLKVIKANQKILEDNRDAYSKFVSAKTDNEIRSAELAKDGWRVDWKTLTLVRSFQ